MGQVLAPILEESLGEGGVDGDVAVGPLAVDEFTFFLAALHAFRGNLLAEGLEIYEVFWRAEGHSGILQDAFLFPDPQPDLRFNHLTLMDFFIDQEVDQLFGFVIDLQV